MSLVQAILAADGETLARLLGEGVHVDTPDERGNTALHLACALGYDTYVPYLTGLGASLDTQNRVGQTPLHLAVRYAHPAVITQLLEKGANPNLADAAGRTPAALAAQLGLVDIAALLPPPPAREAVREKEAGHRGLADIKDTSQEPRKKPKAAFLLKLQAKLGAGGSRKKVHPVLRALKLVGYLVLVLVVAVYYMAFKISREHINKRKEADKAVVRAEAAAREIGDETMAGPDLLNAIVIDPDYSVVYYKYAAIAAQLGSNEEAEKYFKMGKEAEAREAKRNSVHKVALGLLTGIFGKRDEGAGIPPNHPLPGAAPSGAPPAPEVSPSAALSAGAALTDSAVLSPSAPAAGSAPAASPSANAAAPEALSPGAAISPSSAPPAVSP